MDLRRKGMRNERARERQWPPLSVMRRIRWTLPSRHTPPGRCLLRYRRVRVSQTFLLPPSPLFLVSNDLLFSSCLCLSRFDEPIYMDNTASTVRVPRITGVKLCAIFPFLRFTCAGFNLTDRRLQLPTRPSRPLLERFSSLLLRILSARKHHSLRNSLFLSRSSLVAFQSLSSAACHTAPRLRHSVPISAGRHVPILSVLNVILILKLSIFPRLLRSPRPPLRTGRRAYILSFGFLCSSFTSIFALDRTCEERLFALFSA